MSNERSDITGDTPPTSEGCNAMIQRCDIEGLRHKRPPTPSPAVEAAAARLDKLVEDIRRSLPNRKALA